MKKSILTALGCLLLAAAFPIAAFAQELIVGGQAIGIRIQTEGVLVSGLGEVETAEGSRRPAADAGVVRPVRRTRARSPASNRCLIISLPHIRTGICTKS